MRGSTITKYGPSSCVGGLSRVVPIALLALPLGLVQCGSGSAPEAEDDVVAQLAEPVVGGCGAASVTASAATVAAGGTVTVTGSAPLCPVGPTTLFQFTAYHTATALTTIVQPY